MSTGASSLPQPISRRLRFLRGEATQAAFAERVGVSRSALANYETGRSRPDDFTLAKITKALGIPEDFFSSDADPLYGAPSYAATIGQVIEGVPDWTEDEAAFIRLLRLCDGDTIRKVMQVLLDAVADQEVVVTIGTIFTVKDDLQRIVDVASGLRSYRKGSLAEFPETSPMHRIGFKRHAGKGPQ